jgi:hypothetical protein
MRILYREEYERVADLAEDTIKFATEQRLDVSTASRTAQWLLSRARHKNRQLGDESKVVIEGGDKPVGIVQTQVIDIETLGLPLEIRRAILEAIEAKERAGQETPVALLPPKQPVQQESDDDEGEDS